MGVSICVSFKPDHPSVLYTAQPHVFVPTQGDEKEDAGDKTKSVALPSVESLSWSSEYSEM